MLTLSQLFWCLVGCALTLLMALAQMSEEREAEAAIRDCRDSAHQAAELAEHALDAQLTCEGVLSSCVEVLSVSQACACWLADGGME